MAESKNIHILYIEDDPALARLFHRKLVRADYLVDVASSGEIGLAMLAEHGYDVVAVDLELPDMTGLEVIRIMAARGDLPPTIMITGAGNEATAVEAMKLGARDYIIKDIEGLYLEIFPSVVEKVLEEKKLIAEKERTQQALEESEKKYRALVDNSLVGVYRTNVNGNILYANEALAKMFGYESPEEMTALLSPDLWKNPEERKGFLKRLRAEGRINGYELEALQKSGRTKTVLVTASLEGDILSGMVMDITRRKEMEQALMKARNLESLGTVAGGLAHDFNNLLTPILGNISILEEGEDHRSSRYRVLKEIEIASLHAKNLVSRLLTFSKGGTPFKRHASVGRLLEETAGHVLQGFNVQSVFSISPDLWLTDIDYGQIGYALHNVILNAREALKDKGVILLIAENVSVSSDDALPLSPGSYVRVSINDNGRGIPSDQISQIFDPYFSTKGMGPDKGTGLGLAITYSVIKKHDGHVQVRSEPGKGTTVEIYLPASADLSETGAGEATLEVAGTIPRAKETFKRKVLIMDDEAVVLGAAERMLEHIGCKVESARNGEEALKLYGHAMEKGETFDMVILDLSVQGGMGGMETMEELRKIDPEVRAIVSSGYSNDPAMLEFEKYGFKGALPKPYRIDEIRRKLEKALAFARK